MDLRQSDYVHKSFRVLPNYKALRKAQAFEAIFVPADSILPCAFLGHHICAESSGSKNVFSRL